MYETGATVHALEAVEFVKDAAIALSAAARVYRQDTSAYRIPDPRWGVQHTLIKATISSFSATPYSSSTHTVNTSHDSAGRGVRHTFSSWLNSTSRPTR